MSLSDDRRRALVILARRPDGRTEADMRAHGFPVALLTEMVQSGLATAHSQDTRGGDNTQYCGVDYDHRRRPRGYRLKVAQKPRRCRAGQVGLKMLARHASGVPAPHKLSRAQDMSMRPIRCRSQRWAFRFSNEVLPRLETSSYSTVCPSFKVAKPAFSTAKM